MNRAASLLRTDRQLLAPCYQRTSTTHPPSLFSASDFDGASDSLSIAATNTDLPDTASWVDRVTDVLSSGLHGSPTAGYSSMMSAGERELHEFLLEAELAHYFYALTTQLKVKSVEQLKYVEDSDLTEIGFSRPEQRRLKKFFRRYCPQTTIRKLYRRLSLSVGASNRRSHLQTNPTPTTPLNHSPSAASNRNNRFSFSTSRDNLHSDGSIMGVADNAGKFLSDSRFIPSSQLELLELLNEGQFGRTYSAQWHVSPTNKLEIVVCSLNLGGPDGGNKSSLIEQLSQLQSLKHQHLHTIHGLSLDGIEVRLLMEFLPMGSIVNKLRDPTQRLSFPVSLLHRFAVQINQAMAYLETCQVVHGRLSATCVSLCGPDLVKLSDYGLASIIRPKRSKDYTPWMAPEILHGSNPTTFSDVWAYGVTLWELFSYGRLPRAGHSEEHILQAAENSPLWLEQPDACPDPVYDAVLLTCWTPSPSSRPTFRQLSDILPHLCPECWITNRDYIPDPQNGFPTSEDSKMGSRPPVARRELGPHLGVSAQERISVLGKRSSIVWKVFSHRTGLTGFLPTSILSPDPLHEGYGMARGRNGILNGSSNTISSRTSRRDTLTRASKNRSNLEHRRQPSGASVRTNSTSELIGCPDRSTFRHIGHMGSDGKIVGDLGFKIPNKQENSASNFQRTESCINVQAPTTFSPSMTTSKISPSTKRLQLSFMRRKRRSPERGTSLAPDTTSSTSATNNSTGGENFLDLNFQPVDLHFEQSLIDEVFQRFHMELKHFDPEAKAQPSAPVNSTSDSIPATGVSSSSTGLHNGIKAPIAPDPVVPTCTEHSSYNGTTTPPPYQKKPSESMRPLSSSISHSDITDAVHRSDAKNGSFSSSSSKSSATMRSRRPRFPSLTRNRTPSISKATSVDHLATSTQSLRRGSENSATPIIGEPILISKPAALERVRTSRLATREHPPLIPAVSTLNSHPKQTEYSSSSSSDLSTRERRCMTEDRELHPGRNSPHLPPPATSVVAGIRAVRNDLVYRAPTLSSTLGRRKFSHEFMDNEQPINDRFRLSSSRINCQATNSLARPSEYLSNAKGSNGLLSRLDGLSGPNRPMDDRTNLPVKATLLAMPPLSTSNHQKIIVNGSSVSSPSRRTVDTEPNTSSNPVMDQTQQARMFYLDVLNSSKTVRATHNHH